MQSDVAASGQPYEYGQQGQPQQQDQGPSQGQIPIPEQHAAFLMASTAEFHPPQWACEPIEANNEARFDVYRDSRHCATYMIATKAVNLFGRDQECCDHVLGNPTISRKHAAVIHDSEGGVHIVDLMSRHGTFVGKKKLPPHDPVLLHDGDVIKFGQSARIYILRGVSPAHKSAAEKKTWGRIKVKAPKKKSSKTKKPTRSKKYSSAVLKLINDVCYHNLTEEKMDIFLQAVLEMDDGAKQEVGDLLVEKIYAKFEFYAAFVHRNAFCVTVALLKHNLLVEELEANLGVITQLSQSRHDSIYRTDARKILQLLAAVRLDPDNVQSPTGAYVGAAAGQVCPPTMSHQATQKRVMGDDDKLPQENMDGDMEHRSRLNSATTSTQNGDDDTSSQHSGYQPPPAGWTNGYHHTTARPQKEYPLSEPPTTASSNGDYEPPSIPASHSVASLAPQPSANASAFGFISTAPGPANGAANANHRDQDGEASPMSSAGRPSDLTAFSFLHNEAAPASVVDGPAPPRVQAVDFLVEAPSPDKASFESQWENTNESEEWSVELADGFEEYEMLAALEDARIHMVTNDKVGGMQQILLTAEQQQEATVFLVEVMLMPGQSSLTATFKWIVNSLLYDNGHELFIELFKYVLHPFCDADASNPASSHDLDADGDLDAGSRPTLLADPSKGTSDTTQSTREAGDDQDDAEEDEWDVLPVIDYLTENAAIDAARFEQLWAGSTTIGTLSCGLAGDVPDKDNVIAIFQRNRLSCLASGCVDKLIKFFFYGEMMELQSLFCAELVIDLASNTVAGTIKRYAFQQHNEEETEQIDSSFVDYVDKIVQTL